MDLDEKEFECEQLFKLQLAKLGLVAKYSLLNNEEELTKTQFEIENIMMSINHEFWMVKKDIFRLIDQLLLESKLIKLQSTHQKRS